MGTGPCSKHKQNCQKPEVNTSKASEILQFEAW